jgi:hypothetical protein
MQLSGEYGLDELVRTLQGNFSCQKVTKNSKGKTLPLEEQKIVMELFFLHVELIPVKGIIEIYSISDDEKGVKKLNKLMTLTAK